MIPGQSDHVLLTSSPSLSRPPSLLIQTQENNSPFSTASHVSEPTFQVEPKKIPRPYQQLPKTQLTKFLFLPFIPNIFLIPHSLSRQSVIQLT